MSAADFLAQRAEHMAEPASADPLLSFSTETVPEPLTVSSGSNPLLAALSFTVGRGAADSYCQKIVIRIPIGTGPDDLIASVDAVASIRTSVRGGTDPDHGDGWSASKADDGEYCIVTFEPYYEPVFDSTWTVGLILSNVQVNSATGTVPVEIVEYTAPTASGYTAKTTTAEIVKFPSGFTFRNFRPRELSVANGAGTTLTWEGSAATYEMFYGSSGQGIDVSSERRWETPDLTDTTSFTLRATVSNSSGELRLSRTTMVLVGDPGLRFKDLVAEERLTVGGAAPALTIDRSGAQFTVPVTAGRVVTPNVSLSGGATYSVTTLRLPDPVTLRGTLRLAAGGSIAARSVLDLREVDIRVVGAAETAATTEFTAETDGMLMVHNRHYETHLELVGTSTYLLIPKEATLTYPLQRDAVVRVRGGDNTLTWVPFAAG